MKVWLRCVLAVCLLGAAGSAQDALVVLANQTVKVQAAGVTAAYSINSYYADAALDEGAVVITGVRPGSTTIMLITTTGVRSLPVTVRPPAPTSPAGIEMERLHGAFYEAGTVETRYTSDPAQWANTVDFTRREQARTMRMALSEINMFSENAEHPVAIPFATYQVLTPNRDIVLIDYAANTTPLTLNNVTVRGLHWRERDFDFHAGFAANAMFQNFFLPTDRTYVVGASYALRFGKRFVVTPGVYWYQPETQNTLQRSSRTTGSTYARYTFSERHWIDSELGVSSVVGAYGGYHLETGGQALEAKIRYKPQGFASAGITDLQGRTASGTWTRRFGDRWISLARFNSDQYDLAGSTQSNTTASGTATYRISSQWTANAGVTFGHLSSTGTGTTPLSANVQTWNVPLTASYVYRHLGLTGGYQYSFVQNSSAGSQWNFGARYSVSSINLSGYWNRQTHVPTLGAIFAQFPGLEDQLIRLGLAATSIEQLGALLQQNAILQALGYTSAMQLNISPVRTQIGSTVAWVSRGKLHQQLQGNFLLSRTEELTSTSNSMIAGGTYIANFTPANAVFLSVSVSRYSMPGNRTMVQPVVALSFRRTLSSVPALIMPARGITVRGTVFLEEKGETGKESTPVAEVPLILDGTVTTMTDARGNFVFRHIPAGKHVVEVGQAELGRPYVFTTSSRFEFERDTNVRVGISFSGTYVLGAVMNDAQQPLPRVAVAIAGNHVSRTVMTDAGGRFTVSDLPEGQYTFSPSPESLPAGYAIDEIEAQTANVKPGDPARLSFSIRALRNIAGIVQMYDRAQGRNNPVADAEVTIVELKRTTRTNTEGRYLFRDLPPGNYHLSARKGDAVSEPEEIEVPAGPSFRRDLELTIAPPSTKK